MSALDIISRALAEVDRKTVGSVGSGRLVEPTVIPFEKQSGRLGRLGRPQKTVGRGQSAQSASRVQLVLTVETDGKPMRATMVGAIGQSREQAIESAKSRFCDRQVQIDGGAA